jgi:hypothetical protein
MLHYENNLLSAENEKTFIDVIQYFLDVTIQR